MTETSTPQRCPVSVECNPFELTQQADPYPRFASPREQVPVFLSPAAGAWIIVRDAGVELMKTPEVFSSVNGPLDLLEDVGYPLTWTGASSDIMTTARPRREPI